MPFEVASTVASSYFWPLVDWMYNGEVLFGVRLIEQNSAFLTNLWQITNRDYYIITEAVQNLCIILREHNTAFILPSLIRPD